MEKLSGTELTKTVFENYENGKYDEYFADKKPVSDYLTVNKVYDDKENVIGIGFVTLDMYRSVSSRAVCQDFTFTNYMNFTEDFNHVYWHPDTTALFTDSGKSTGMTFDELEHDTLTITVEFNDGSAQTVCYDLGFNSQGNMTIEKLK